MENKHLVDLDLPENAKLVHKGIIFDVYQWEQELFDGSYTTFEAIRRNPTVQIFAITKEKKIILLNEEQPQIGKFISVPGGHVEDNETPLENAEKELLEETGMSSKNFKLWKKFNFMKKIVWDSYYFIAKDCIKISNPTPEAGEKIELFEVTFDEFIEYSQKDTFRNKALKDLIFKMLKTEGEIEKFKKELFE